MDGTLSAFCPDQLWSVPFLCHVPMSYGSYPFCVLSQCIMDRTLSVPCFFMKKGVGKKIYKYDNSASFHSFPVLLTRSPESLGNPIGKRLARVCPPESVADHERVVHAQAEQYKRQHLRSRAGGGSYDAIGWFD